MKSEALSHEARLLYPNTSRKHLPENAPMWFQPLNSLKARGPSQLSSAFEPKDVGFNMAGRGTGAVAYKAPEVYDGVFTTASEVGARESPPG